MKVIKAIWKYIIAFTAGLKETTEAVNSAESVAELDCKINEITGI